MGSESIAHEAGGPMGYWPCSVKTSQNAALIIDWPLKVKCDQYRCDALPTELWSHTLGARSIYWINLFNKLTLLPMCGFIAQLVEHRTGIAEVMGSNPVEALIFFRLLLSNCLNWKIYCDDHTSLSSTTAVQIWIISYIFHKTDH